MNDLQMTREGDLYVNNDIAVTDREFISDLGGFSRNGSLDRITELNTLKISLLKILISS